LSRTTGHVKWQKFKFLNGFTPSNATLIWCFVFQWKIVTSCQICASNFWNLGHFELGHLCLLHVHAKSTIPPKFCTYIVIVVLESKGSVQAISMEHKTICPQTYQWALYLARGLSSSSIIVTWLTTYKLKNLQTMGLMLLWS
jgi:hypothetical protein